MNNLKERDSTATRELCRRIEIGRLKSGLTYNRLATLADVQPSVAYALCNGQIKSSPALFTVLRLARAMDVGLDQLCEGL